MFKRLLQLIFIFMFSIVLFKHSGYCDIKIFLQPKIIINNDNLILKDIALVEGNNSDIEKIKNIRINKDVFSDGYIDKKEIICLLKQNTEDSIFILGNAVRIFSNDYIIKDTVIETPEIIIKKGDVVNIVVKKNGISVLLKGSAINEGRIDEEVMVRLIKKATAVKQVKAKIISKDLVEVNL